MTKPTTWTPTPESAVARLKGRLFATTREASAVLDCDIRTLRKDIEAGKIPATRVGSTWRVPVAWIREQAGLDGGPTAA